MLWLRVSRSVLPIFLIIMLFDNSLCASSNGLTNVLDVSQILVCERLAKRVPKQLQDSRITEKQEIQNLLLEVAANEEASDDIKRAWLSPLLLVKGSISR